MFCIEDNFTENYVGLNHSISYVKNSIPVPTFCWNNMQYASDIKAPYMDVVSDYKKEKGTTGFRRIILVTEDTNMAIKATAVFAGYGADCYECDELAWDDQYPEYDEEMANCGSPVLNVDLAKYGDKDNKDMNLRVMLPNANFANIHSIFYTNAALYNDWDDLLACMSLCNIPCQYIQIEPKALSTPAVQRMIYELNFVPIIMPKFPKNYYLGVMDKLMEGAEYTFAHNCNKDKLLRGLMKKRGHRIGEEDIATFLKLAISEAAKDCDRKELKNEDFSVTVCVDKVSAWDKLNNMVGLNNVKYVVEESVALMSEQLNNSLLKTGKNHMLFYGNPGTGKTTCAKLVADVYDEAGVGNGNFVMATRKDLVGKYVGHTAHQVAKCFENARGGVLFVDEAGFLLDEKAGGFVEEAIKEFVRYMEEYDDVMVVFAMYPREAEGFLELDEGLRSRITRQVEFEDYSTDELTDITVDMLFDNGYTLKKGAKEAIRNYIEEARNSEDEEFGNARAARKLTEAIISQISINNYRTGKKERRASVADVNRAVDKLNGVKPVSKNPIGFVYNTVTD